jgi:methylated-DNA-[protein]-cysteine S-methyltransferase
MTQRYITTYLSPLGSLTLVATDHHLLGLYFTCPPALASLPAGTTPVHRLAITQLDAYFAHRLRVFTLPLSPAGTPFQTRVWRALQQIPYGRTCTYGDIAAAINQPRACRAIGQANNKNPISIIIPCHRVIGASGALVGYGSGLDKKQWLLNFETAAPPNGNN